MSAATDKGFLPGWWVSAKLTEDKRTVSAGPYDTQEFAKGVAARWRRVPTAYVRSTVKVWEVKP